MKKGRILDRSETAEFFGVLPTAVDAWVRQGCPVVKRATRRRGGAAFDSVAMVAWLHDQAVANVVENLAAVDEQQARRRKLAAEAALAELELERARGEYVSAALVGEVWCRLVSNFRARILGVPSKLAARLAAFTTPGEVQQTLRNELYAALAELSDEGGVKGIPEFLETRLREDEAASAPRTDAEAHEERQS